MDMWSFGTMLASMIFRKEPFFYGSSCIDQLLSAARVLGTESLYRFVEDYGIQMEQEDVETLGHHPRQSWRELTTSDNQHLATNEAIDLVDRLLQFDPRVSGRDSRIPQNTNVHALAPSYSDRGPLACLLLTPVIRPLLHCNFNPLRNATSSTAIRTFPHSSLLL